MKFNRSYYVQDYRFQGLREVILNDPFRWHGMVGIDTEAVASGQGIPNCITGDGKDRLYAASAFQKTGAVRDRYKRWTYDAIGAYIAKGLAQNRIDAAGKLIELYGKRVAIQEAYAIFRRHDKHPSHRIVRTEYSDGSIECREYKFKIKFYRDGNYKSGTYVPSEREIVAPYPLNYPKLLVRNEILYIVETEAECEVLTTFDFLTTSASDRDKTTLDWARFVRKREVVLLPARDKAGYEFATRVAESLRRVGCTIKIVQLPGLRGGENIRHWIKRGGQPDKLWQVVKETPVWAGLLFSYQSVSAQPERQRQ
jgi:hypothetical protein